MLPDERWKLANFGFLYDATATLLGYFVRTWYGHFLNVITRNLHRWNERGLIANMIEPTEEGAYFPLFDIDALDMEKIVYINGVYLYILMSHKEANRRLMRQSDRKRVLYLRGYDFEGAVAAAEGLAIGVSSMKTTGFNWTLSRLLVPHFEVFKVMSPKDVYWETVEAQHFFYGRYRDLVGYAQHSILSFYVNALRWKEDVGYLMDGMDHFVVYVSSMTESVLWEIDQLDTDDRRGRVTMVFDEKAIMEKEIHMDVRDRMKETFGDQVLWSKEGPPPHESVAELREQLSKKFFVTTPEEFEKNIDMHRQRIEAGSSRLASGKRETWLDFHFHPAVDEEKLKELRDFSDWVQAYIAKCTGERGIDCLMLFLNHIQLRIFMTLLMGEHDEAGLALAAYSAVMLSTMDFCAGPLKKAGWLSEEELKPLIDLLDDHRDIGEYIGMRLLAYGKSHQFDDLTAIATAEFSQAFESTRVAAEKFYEITAGRIVPRQSE